MSLYDCFLTILNIEPSLGFAVQATTLQVVVDFLVVSLQAPDLVNSRRIVDIDDGEEGGRILYAIGQLQVLREWLEFNALLQHKAVAFYDIDILLRMAAIVVIDVQAGGQGLLKQGCVDVPISKSHGFAGQRGVNAQQAEVLAAVVRLNLYLTLRDAAVLEVGR